MEEIDWQWSTANQGAEDNALLIRSVQNCYNEESLDLKIIIASQFHSISEMFTPFLFI